MVSNRGKDGRFVKGHSGNPNGRPKGSQSPSDFLRRKLEEGGTLEGIMTRVVYLALSGERWAVELIFDRLEGKPIQYVDIEQRIIEAAEREGVDPKQAVETARRILEESREWS